MLDFSAMLMIGAQSDKAVRDVLIKEESVSDCDVPMWDCGNTRPRPRPTRLNPALLANRNFSVQPLLDGGRRSAP